MRNQTSQVKAVESCGEILVENTLDTAYLLCAGGFTSSLLGSGHFKLI